MLDINKQKMKYSQGGQKVFIYERDEDGNILYEGYQSDDGFVYYHDSNGNKIPKGEEVEGFSEPKEFYANISNKLSEVLVKEFGIDDSTSYCQLVTDKGYLPLKAVPNLFRQTRRQYRRYLTICLINKNLRHILFTNERVDL